MTALAAEQACAPRITSGHDVEPYSSWVRRARCAGQSAVFADNERAAEAIEVCQRCPVLRQCRSWALHNAVDGVAGGMTNDERETWRKANGVGEPTLRADDFVPAEIVSAGTKWGRGRSDGILRAVEQWTANGESGRQIATRLGVTRRTVSRLRAMCPQRQAS